MKFKFKEQQFQLDAVMSVVDCFIGQPKEFSEYTLDKGKKVHNGYEEVTFFEAEKGFRNKKIVIRNVDIFNKIKKVQKDNGLIQSKKLEGEYNLTIEMETGERVIIVTGCINVLVSRVSGTLTKYNSCIA